MDEPAVLSARALQECLHEVTETLAEELAHPATRAPHWSQAQWALAPAVAAIHGVSSLLARRLRWRGPAAWEQFLRSQQAHTAQRQRRIEALLGRLHDAAREARVPLVPLKGAALCAGGFYAPGERPMADIDLLLPAAAAQRGAALLKRLGFREQGRTWKHLVLVQPAGRPAAALGEDFRNELKIELHWRVGERLPLRPLDCTALILSHDCRAGLNDYASDGALLLHVLLHTAGAMTRRELRLLQLSDVARLSAVMMAADWERAWQLAGSIGDGSAWWVLPPLLLTARYFGAVPEAQLERAAERCHWRLRRAATRGTLSGFSASYPWISAFPGLAWARNASEACEYLLARVVPGRDTLWQRRQQAAAQPRVSGGSWAQLSQRQRVCRWLTGRQARQQTLQPVVAALSVARGRALQAPGDAPAITLV